MGRRKKTRQIVVIGRNWWRRGAGGNYTTATVYVNGEWVWKSDVRGGSGDYYKQMAADWLRANGYLPDQEENKPLWHYRDDYGIQLITEGIDVSRERDL